MKKIIYLLFVLVIFSSCDDKFVDKLPYGRTIPENTDDLARMLNVTTKINVGGRNWLYMSDDMGIPSDNISALGNIDLNSYIWSDFMYTENDTDDDWAAHYSIISRANYVIHNIDELEEGAEFDIANTKGRAYFTRAHSYFYLVNAYAPHYNSSTASTDLGVPMALEMDINASLPRASVQEIYDLIMSDLEIAMDNLPEVGKHSTYAGKMSVYALMGRIYLYQEEYELAAQYSKMALDINNVLLDYNTFQPQFTSGGTIRRVGGWDTNLLTNPENVYYSKAPGYHTGLYLSNDLISTFDQDNDFRFKYFITKFQGTYQPNIEGNLPWTGIRMAEIYLNYCEALMKQASPNNTEAVTYLNTLRENRLDAATYTAFAHVDNATTLAEIMQERRRELRLTAWRWFDMKRLGLTATRTVDGQTYTLTSGSNNYVWAIPLNVMALNKLLEQNPRGL